MLENVGDLHVVPLDSEEMQTMQSQAQVIADLKAQLQQERAKKPCPVGPSSSMEPLSKRVRLSGKTSLPVSDASAKEPEPVAEEALSPSRQISQLVLRDVSMAGVAKTNVPSG